MSYFTRLRDPILSLLKEEAGAAAQVAALPVKMGGHDRAEAARRAWEVRRARFGPGGGNLKGHGKGKAPAQPKAPAAEPIKPGGDSGELNRKLQGAMDKIKERLKPHGYLKNLVDVMPWDKKPLMGAGRRAPKGINRSGMLSVDGEKFFGKAQKQSETEIEQGAWDLAQKLGWEDMSRPTASHTISFQADGRGQVKGILVQPLLPEGDVIGAKHVRPNMSVDKGHRMMLFDYAIGGGDRHEENFWVDNKGEVYGIDYARSYQKNPFGRGTLARFGAIKDYDAPRGLVEHIVNNEKSIIDSIPAKGGYETPYPEAVAAVKTRVEKLRKHLVAHPDDRKVNLRQLIVL
jgi:hypothetical protein